ncbi:hypothetical protein B0J12DRAFT_291467 [Macrophomina phaseolina]|uniref:Uncharacterized protein n=1 Tax=Macrophomina phaseolina TaxID=35725 RepID=A0ABQ8GNM8_9PEZI|nr:hypothetical protein B0J12DRAFT_291467 [Macrophomina phaseolina]
MRWRVFNSALVMPFLFFSFCCHGGLESFLSSLSHISPNSLRPFVHLGVLFTLSIPYVRLWLIPRLFVCIFVRAFLFLLLFSGIVYPEFFFFFFFLRFSCIYLHPIFSVSVCVFVIFSTWKQGFTAIFCCHQGRPVSLSVIYIAIWRLHACLLTWLFCSPARCGLTVAGIRYHFRRRLGPFIPSWIAACRWLVCAC